MGKNVVVAYFKAFSGQLLAGVRKMKEKEKTIRIVGLHAEKHNLNSTILKKVPPSNLLSPTLTILTRQPCKLIRL
jgi:hypothetical protein